MRGKTTVFRRPVSSYYRFQKYLIDSRGHQITVWGKPGVWSWNHSNAGTAALLDVIEVHSQERVLDLGCGTGVIGAAVARWNPGGRVVLVDCSLPAVASAERTLSANGVRNAEVRLADGVADLDAGEFDAVLCHLPRGRAVQEELIRGAAWTLRSPGRLYIVAHRRAGIKGAVAFARSLFGRCAVIRQKKGYHVAVAVRPADLHVTRPQNGYVSKRIDLGSREVVLVTKPGVFAWDRLDVGTAALVKAMRIGEQDRVLDLGCGSGLAGLAAARHASSGSVILVDADIRAVESARRTLEANGQRNAEAVVSDCASSVRDQSFDVVVTNPPFHQGTGVEFDVAHQFIADAAQVLVPGGRLFLVANRHLRYDTLVREVFGNSAVEYSDNRFQVLSAVTQRL